jgi:hypothetical protein
MPKGTAVVAAPARLEALARFKPVPAPPQRDTESCNS